MEPRRKALQRRRKRLYDQPDANAIVDYHVFNWRGKPKFIAAAGRVARREKVRGAGSGALVSRATMQWEGNRNIMEEGS